MVATSATMTTGVNAFKPDSHGLVTHSRDMTIGEWIKSGDNGGERHRSYISSHGVVGVRAERHHSMEHGNGS